MKKLLLLLIIPFLLYSCSSNEDDDEPVTTESTSTEVIDDFKFTFIYDANSEYQYVKIENILNNEYPFWNAGSMLEIYTEEQVYVWKPQSQYEFIADISNNTLKNISYKDIIAIDLRNDILNEYVYLYIKGKKEMNKTLRMFFK